MVDSELEWNNVICPICLDFPHNGVLLRCSSYDKGCRSFVCDTNHLHSNCFDRFRSACGLPTSTSDANSTENRDPVASDEICKLSCPLCRGQISGWTVIDSARIYLDKKLRCCEEEECTFTGTYPELQKHAQLQHPLSRPSEIDPARKLVWEKFLQSSEILDVLSTIHSEVPGGVISGDYVIEYDSDDSNDSNDSYDSYDSHDSRDEFEDFPGDEGNWWSSCILYKVFDNLRNFRNRRRSRTGNTRRGTQRLSFDNSNSDEVSVTSVDYAEYRLDETVGEFVNASGRSRVGGNDRSSRRRHFQFHDN